MIRIQRIERLMTRAHAFGMVGGALEEHEERVTIVRDWHLNDSRYPYKTQYKRVTIVADMDTKNKRIVARAFMTLIRDMLTEKISNVKPLNPEGRYPLLPTTSVELRNRTGATGAILASKARELGYLDKYPFVIVERLDGARTAPGLTPSEGYRVANAMEVQAYYELESLTADFGAGLNPVSADPLAKQPQLNNDFNAIVTGRARVKAYLRLDRAGKCYLLLDKTKLTPHAHMAKYVVKKAMGRKAIVVDVNKAHNLREEIELMRKLGYLYMREIVCFQYNAAGHPRLLTYAPTLGRFIVYPIFTEAQP